jgi:DNA-binding Lrp family transcriptional regulator
MGIFFSKFKKNKASGATQHQGEAPNESDSAKSFDESQRKEEAFDTKDRGVRAVALDQIVGSVGRYHDFDSSFRLRSHMPSERLEAVKKAMRQGKRLPPVKLYQIKDEYYVLDGNHRIAAAHELGYSDVQARIVEFIPSKKTIGNILYRQRSAFEERTKLPFKIILTELGQYTYLEQQIERHLQCLEETQKTPIPFERAASDWYHTIYEPMVALIERTDLLASFPQRTVADLFAYISYHQWEMRRQRSYGMGIDEMIPHSMEAFREKMRPMKKSEYPEMHRGITAFILMKVQASRERRIIDKLFAHDEVREIHSVHGDVDMIVKIVLTRDLLSSDSEVISQFVHNNIRLLPGVNSTETLIPGISRIKDNPPAR